MKKHTILLFIFLNICIGLISCSNIDSSSNTDNNQESSTNSENNTNNYASLKIVCNYSGFISRVALVGYTFENLRISTGESKTFELLNGIAGGYENVNVNISFSPVISGGYVRTDTRSPISVKCNFTKGKTTTITLIDGNSGSDIIKVSY